MGPLGFFGFGSKQSQDTEQQQFSRDQRELRDEGGGFAVNSSESVALGSGSASAAAQRPGKVIGTGIHQHQQGVAGAPGPGGATNQHMGNQPSSQHASGGVYPQYGGGGGAHGHQYQQYGYQGHGGLQGGGQFEYGHGGGGYQQSYRPSNPNSVGTLQAGYNRNGHPTLNAPAPPPSASAIGGYAPSTSGLNHSGRTGLSGGGRMDRDTSMSSPGTERASSHEQPGGISSDAVSEENYQAAKRGRNSGHEKNHHNNNHRVEGREERDGRERDRNDRRKRTGSDEVASGSGGQGQVNRQASRNPPQPRLNEEEYEFIARDIMSKPPFAGYLKYHLPVRYAARCEEVRWEWIDSNGRLCRQELIGGGKNSDLEYD